MVPFITCCTRAIAVTTSHHTFVQDAALACMFCKLNNKHLASCTDPTRPG